MAMSRIRLLAAVVMLTTLVPGTNSAQSLLPDEVLVESTYSIGMENELPLYLSVQTMVFVGQLQARSGEFVGDHDSKSLATRMTFRPMDVLKGTLPIGQPIDVWTSGGTYLQTGAVKTPRRLSEIADTMTVGSTYLVAASIRLGRLFAATGVLVELDGTGAVGGPHIDQQWLQTTIASGRANLLEVAPTAVPTDREAFLHQIQTAVMTHP